MKDLIIKPDFIKLDQALKLSGLVLTGGEAKEVIQNGEVKVNGEICLMRGKKLREGDIFSFDNEKFIIKFN